MNDQLNDQEVLQDDNGLEVVDFADKEAFLFQGVSDARWERAKANPDVRDLLSDLYGVRGNPVSCPFHGSDSKPSFYIYPQNNDCWCWGCGEVDGYWDNLKIIARHFGHRTPDGKDDRALALKWLEAHYPMPVLKDDDSYRPPDLIIVEEEASSIPDDPLAQVEFRLLREHFVRLAASRVQAAGDPESALTIAQEHLELLFSAVRDGNKLALARALGRTLTLTLIHTH